MAVAAALALTGCGKGGDSASSGSGDSGGSSGQKKTVANIGSDTMVNLAAAWAEAYGAVDKNTLVEVNGGGSGVGVKGLINGTADLANCSRHMSDKEKAELKEKRQLPTRRSSSSASTRSPSTSTRTIR